jgi:hypothetical protein
MLQTGLSQMSEQKLKSLAALLNSFPQTVPDLELGMRTYLAVLRDFDDVHVSQAVGRFLRGEVPEANPRFAPSCAELAQEVRAQAERDRLASRRAELEATLAADLARLKGDDGIPFEEGRSALRRIPTFREKYLGNGNANG